MTESQRTQMLADCKRMLRSLTREELDIQDQAVREVQETWANIKIAQSKLDQLLKFCKQNNLVICGKTIYWKGDDVNDDTSN